MCSGINRGWLFLVEVWLNPSGVPESRLKNRTLAKLHAALDAAVCEAYGWPQEVLDNEEAILERLLALNLERAAAQEEA